MTKAFSLWKVSETSIETHVLCLYSIRSPTGGFLKPHINEDLSRQVSQFPVFQFSIRFTFSEYMTLCATLLSHHNWRTLCYYVLERMEDGSRTCRVGTVGSQQLSRQDDESDTALTAIELLHLIQGCFYCEYKIL